MYCSKLKWLAPALVLAGSLTLAQEAGTPSHSDLQVQFRSAAGSNRFRIGEVIPIEVLLSSPKPNRYLEPCALFRESNFGFPQCRFFSRWSFSITPETGWVDYTKEFDGPRTFGGPTFEVPAHYLTAQPVIFSYVLTNRFRFDKPGEYTIHFQLDVGVDDEATKAQAHPRGTTVTREIVLQIVPADPGWQKEIVHQGTEAWLEPSLRETQSLLDYKRARLALCTLGTPDAAGVLAKAVLSSYQEAENCLQRSPSLSAAVEEMRRLLVDPDIAVTPNFFSVLVRLDAEEFRRVGASVLTQDIVNTERDVLFRSLPRKRGNAQYESLSTVLRNPLRTELNSGGDALDLPFSTEVITAAADN
ncbi:MAG: hypothetical protein ABSD39_17065 [Terriglobales bacterium]|jgi:hypothetical protein